MPSSSRKFGHCIVSWEIQNYGRALWQKDLEIETLEFSIQGPNSQATKWKLMLKTESNNNSLVEELNVSVKFPDNEESFNPVTEELCETDSKEKTLSNLSEDEKELYGLCLNENEIVDSRLSLKNLMMYLERGIDEGPDTVYADCKVYYIGIKGDKVSLVHHDHYFYKNIKYGFNIGTLYDFERDFEYNSGFMTILCDIIVRDTDSSQMFNDERSIDLYGLSEDLQSIFDRQKFCDVEINVDGKSVKAHKAILCTHSEYFRREVEKGSSVFELSNMKYNEVLKVLEYMYSHNLADVIGKPSVSVYDAAIQMNLTDLVEHYAPEEVKINTNVELKKLTHQWVINDFSKINHCISSSILKNNHDDTAWQIYLYPKGIDGRSEYISLTVECIDGNISDDFCIQCAVLRNNENHNIWKKLQKAEDNNTVVRDAEFILRQDMFKLLNNDTLRLGFKVRTCTGKESSILSIPCTPVLYSMGKSFDNMKKNMRFLRESNKYTDVTFKFGNKEIKVHKFILSARSLMFCRKFEEACNGIPLLSITPETFEILLDYMYCNTFNVEDINTVIDIYESADEYLISRLQVKCSRFLQNIVKVDNAIRIFTLASDHDDQCLKETAQKFMDTNKKALQKRYVKEPKTTVVPSKKDYNVSAECITKCTSVIKYNEITIVKYDFEFVERPMNGSVDQTSQNGKSSPDNIAAKENNSDTIVAEFLEDVYINGENKSLAKKQMINYIDYSTNPENREKLKVLSQRNYYSNGVDSSANIVETKTNEQLIQDNEMRYVHIDSKGNEIKENLSPFKISSEKGRIFATSEKNASEQSKQKSTNELYQGMQSCLIGFQQIHEDLDAAVAAKKLDRKRQESLDEQTGRNLKSNVGHESQKEDLKLDRDESEIA